MGKWSEFFKRAGIMFADADKTRMAYVPYCDSEGNYLGAEEIIFTDAESFHEKQNLGVFEEVKEKGQEYTVYSPGVTPIYDESGNFPIALKTPDGKLAYLKVSKRTGEVLPIHAGCCQVLSIIFTGPPSAGKTVNVLQLSDPLFHDMLARYTTCSFEDDLPSEAPKRRKYEDERIKLKNHVLPEPTKRNEILLPYVYYIQYGEPGRERRALLKLEDIDGEQCTEMTWDSKIFQSNYFILCIGADEIIAGEKGESVQYTRVIDQLLPRLRVLRHEKDYEILVMITKSDCLDKKNEHLATAFENSICYTDGKWEQTIHAKGFDYDVFNQRGKCVEEFLMDECPNFINKLTNIVPRQNITFCMIASVGEKSQDNKFENYTPFCVDEPLLSILAKAGMYPISVKDEGPTEKEVESITGVNFRDYYELLLSSICNKSKKYIVKSANKKSSRNL